jgi:signal transduction histidine kinase
LDHGAALASSSTAWERLLMECDIQGHILWMNGRARARLGPVESMFVALPALDVPKFSELLSSREPGRRPEVTSTVQCADRPARVPVRLVRLLALDSRVVVSAEVRGRASDALPPHQQILGTLLRMQSNAMRNYFRLQRAQELLEVRRRPARSLGSVVSKALETERTRIARELHSGAGQTLAGIKVNLELIEARMPNPPEALRNGLARIHMLADQALSEIRSVSQRLHPPDWQRLDLREALELLWNMTGIPEKFHATLEVHPLESDLPDAVRFSVYRSAQEGLANVLRHSGATEVKLELDQRNDRIYLVLQDNGSGFDVQEVLHGELTPAMRGIGLRAMREEILALNGQFRLASTAGGTRMEITVPITENR